VTYFSKPKMACTEFSSDNNFYIKGETSLCYFILKTVRFLCRTCIRQFHYMLTSKREKKFYDIDYEDDRRGGCVPKID